MHKHQRITRSHDHNIFRTHDVHVIQLDTRQHLVYSGQSAVIYPLKVDDRIPMWVSLTQPVHGKLYQLFENPQVT